MDGQFNQSSKRRLALAALLAGAFASVSMAADVSVGASRGVARLKSKCAGCGVIESIRRIEVDEQRNGHCLANDDGKRLTGALLGGRKETITLADTIAGAVGIDERGNRVRRTGAYQIVVRFRDGTRHVFTETTPGTMRQGERMLVVAPQRFAG